MDEDPAQPHSDETPVLRMLFDVQDGQVHLLDVQQVEMRIPPSASLEERRNVAGAWVEVRDAGGAPIFRHDLSPSLLDGIEVFPQDPFGEIIRVPGLPRTFAFSVLAPLPPGADRLVLVGAPGASVRQAARELTQVDARELRERAQRRPQRGSRE